MYHLNVVDQYVNSNPFQMITNEITIAGNSKTPLKVNRFGFGTMRLTGQGIWGEPKNRPEALQILKQCISSGIQFLDTADYYGDDITNRLIAEALYPYPANLVICTKVGCTRKPDKSWIPFSRPEQLRTSLERNLRHPQTGPDDAGSFQGSSRQ